MKKFFKSLSVSLAILMLCINVFSVASVIVIDGASAEIPEDMGKIVEMDNRTFVPLRFVSEYLGSNVWFDEETKSACVYSADSFILVQSGNNILYKTDTNSGEALKIEMDTNAFINEEEGRTYIPIRFLAEAIGYEVGWDEATQTVTLNQKQAE